MIAEDGECRERKIDPTASETLGEMSPERMMALLGRILASPENAIREKRLRVFWRLWVRADPTLQQAVRVRFFQDTLSSLPEEQESNPIRRKLLYEMTLPPNPPPICR
jgi:hypothetical protein